MTVRFLSRPGLPALAYRLVPAARPGLPTVVFFTGFASDMDGTKAAFLSDACTARGQGFLRFDYRGHGRSEGAFTDGTIGTWKQDALDVIDAFTTGPLLLVGSSMGGWIALLTALARKDRAAGLIGLAAAPDFTRDIPARMTEAQKKTLAEEGAFPLPSDYGDRPYSITRALLEDGEHHCLLPGPVDLHCPVRLIQGMKDTDVPWQMAHRISAAVAGEDKKVYLREEGDHRLSAPDDLALLEKLVAELSGG